MLFKDQVHKPNLVETLHMPILHQLLYNIITKMYVDTVRRPIQGYTIEGALHKSLHDRRKKNYKSHIIIAQWSFIQDFCRGKEGFWLMNKLGFHIVINHELVTRVFSPHL